MDSVWRTVRWGRRRDGVVRMGEMTYTTGVPGRRDRTALGTAIRGLADAPDLASATSLITANAAWLLHAEGAMVVRIDDGRPRVACAHGDVAASVDQAVPVAGALAEVMRTGRAAEIRASGRAEVAAPIALAGGTWGAMTVHGPAARIPRHGPERLAPFADLVSLAAANHEHRTHLASLAGTDPLTGLGNRRTFDSLLAAEVDRAGRHEDPLSLVLLDIDHFKSVNDRFGHQLGDRVLVEVGRRLVAIARRGEAVTRIGGEEFAWILPRTGGEGTHAAAARALSSISGAPFEGVGPLTVSAGVCDLAHAGCADEMVRLADQMLYRAKADGRNTVRRFAPEAELAQTA